MLSKNYLKLGLFKISQILWITFKLSAHLATTGNGSCSCLVNTGKYFVGLVTRKDYHIGTPTFV